jgi:hypothetical protein
VRLVATRCGLSGGQIRNVVLHAIVLALEEGQPLQQLFVVESLAREYRKLGATSPLGSETLPA